MYQDLQAEQALLGALMMNNNNIDVAQDMISEESFCNIAHRDVYKAIKALIFSGKVADPVSLTTHLKSAEWFQEVGGKDFLQNLNENATAIVKVKTYCEIIQECFKKRQAMQVQEFIMDKFDKDEKADVVLNDAITQLMQVSDDVKSNDNFESLTESVTSVFDASMRAYNLKDPITGLKSGFCALDDITGGLKGGKLIILGARPAMGKSACSFNIAQSVAENYTKQDKGAKVGIFSLEMGRDEIVRRLISGVSGVSNTIIEKGLYKNDYQINAVKKASQYVERLPMFISEGASLHINTIRAKAMKLKRKENIKLLIVDYLQLCRGSSIQKHIEIGEISQGLKQIAKELDICVIALSQLSRGLEARTNKRPMLSDLRESGSIEQDADMIMFLHREEYYAEKQIGASSEDKDYYNNIKAMLEYKGITEFIISKNRGGTCTTLKMMFDGATTSFIDVNNIDFTIGVDKDNVQSIHATLESKFGVNWWNSVDFIKHQNIFLQFVKKSTKEEIESVLYDILNGGLEVLRGSSPVVIGAVASIQGKL